MKHTVEKETLTIFLEGELNSFTSDDADKEISELLKGQQYKAIRVDMGDLVYISSAGLRIIVRIKQQYDDVALINVPASVYEILTMVGFQNLMTIEQK